MMNFESAGLTDFELQNEMDKCLRCEARPCREACPCHCSPMDFIMIAQQGDYSRAAARILSMNPLGGVCGAVCPDSFCVAACVREADPVDIPAVQRAIVSRARCGGRPPRWTPIEREARKRVAVVGAGPAGLACAAVLARLGHRVVLFDRAQRPGGTLRAIPSARLPAHLLQQDVRHVLEGAAAGRVHLRLRSDVRDFGALESSFDAVCLALGRQKPRRVEGLQGAHAAVPFLMDPSDRVDGAHCAIIGGGAVAVDVATVCAERNAKSVTIVYRRSYSDMKLTAKERKMLLRLRVELIFRSTPKHWDGSTLTIMQQDHEMQLPFSRCFLAIGDELDCDIPLNLPKSIICGGPTVVESAASGKNAGAAIHRFLSGQQASLGRTVSLKSEAEVSGYNFYPRPLNTSFFGIPMDHPFILSASPLTDSYERVKLAYEAGWAGAVLKTAFADGNYIHIPSLYMSRLAKNTFGNCDNVSAVPISEMAQTCARLVKEFPSKLTIASTGGDPREPSAWVSNTKMLEKAGAHAVEYSLSCPQGEIIASQDPEIAARIVTWVLESCNGQVPKLFKLSPLVANVKEIVSAVKAVFDQFPSSKAGITLANSFPVVWEGRVLGMAGEAVAPISIGSLAKLSGMDVHISGNGGVMNAKIAHDFLSLGATTVQICTAAEINGLSFVDELKSGVAHMPPPAPYCVVPFEALDNQPMVSVLNQELCVKCGNCTRCPYGAIEMSIEHGYPQINPQKCVGCSMCVLNCPSKGALAMEQKVASTY